MTKANDENFYDSQSYSVHGVYLTFLMTALKPPTALLCTVLRK